MRFEKGVIKCSYVYSRKQRTNKFYNMGHEVNRRGSRSSNYKEKRRRLNVAFLSLNGNYVVPSFSKVLFMKRALAFDLLLHRKRTLAGQN